MGIKKKVEKTILEKYPFPTLPTTKEAIDLTLQEVMKELDDWVVKLKDDDYFPDEWEKIFGEGGVCYKCLLNFIKELKKRLECNE